MMRGNSSGHATDTGQGSGPSNPGEQGTYLQVLFQELCQLQAKYEIP